MTIAGSDSGGGAGIQADLKTFSALSMHGTCAITSITAQNTLGVQDSYDLPVEIIASQIEAVSSDFDVAYAKTGMLSSSEIIKTVVGKVEKHKIPLVVDPVMVAEAGGTLLKEGALSVLVERLFPLSTVVTPNVFEAGVLTDMKITDEKSAKKAAVEIHNRGARAVIITGGHLDAVDVLYDGEFHFIGGELVAGGTHGAGCTYSAALTVYLANGLALKNAAAKAKEFVTAAITGSMQAGHGSKPVNPLANLSIDAERYRVLMDVRGAVSMLKNCRGFSEIIPEVGTNIGKGVHGASTKDDVAAVNGRIVRSDGARTVGDIDFGASNHIARVILTAMRFDEKMVGAMNIKYSPDILSVCKKLGFSIASFDRGDEPTGVSTMDWGVEEAIQKSGRVPDVIYDVGAIGKEPMVRLLGKSAMEVAEKAVMICKCLGQADA